MTNNFNQTDLLCFKGKIKNKLFSLNLNGKSNTGHKHSASEITGGTLDLARIATGTNHNTVALGGHIHNNYYDYLL